METEKNLQQGLKTLLEKCSNLKNENISQLLYLYRIATVLNYRCADKFKDIFYYTQAIMNNLEDEIKSR